MASIGVVAASAGGVEHLRQRLVGPLLDRGHRVAVTLTPTAARWLRAIDEVEPIAELTELPVRSEPRLPGESGQHPKIDVYVAAPLTATSTAKLALGIGDNQALTVLCESLTTVPMIVFPVSTRRMLVNLPGPITSLGSGPSECTWSTVPRSGRWLNLAPPAPEISPGTPSSPPSTRAWQLPREDFLYSFKAGGGGHAADRR